MAALGVALGSIWVVGRSRPGPTGPNPIGFGAPGRGLGEGNVVYMALWTWPLDMIGSLNIEQKTDLNARP